MSPLKLAAAGALFITFADAASAATNWEASHPRRLKLIIVWLIRTAESIRKSGAAKSTMRKPLDCIGTTIKFVVKSV